METFPRRPAGVLATALALIGMHAFLVGVALDWRADYLKAVSGFAVLWFLIAVVCLVGACKSKPVR